MNNFFSGKVFGSCTVGERGQIVIPAEGLTEDKVFEAAIEAGADDVQSDEGEFTVMTSFEEMHQVADGLQKAGLTASSIKAVYIPSTTVKLAGEQTRGLLKLIDNLENNDDVANVWANFDIDEKDLEAFEG